MRVPLVPPAVFKARSSKNFFRLLSGIESAIICLVSRKAILGTCFDMCMLDEIRAKREEIYAIARAHKAEKLWVFGSCARKTELPDSDVDFLVEFAPATTIFDYVKLKDSLSQTLGREVDIVDAFALEREDRFSLEALKDRVAV